MGNMLRGIADWMFEAGWLGGRVGRKIVVSVLPARVHFAIAHYRAWIWFFLLGPPKHALRNIEDAFGHRSRADIKAIAREYALFSRSSRVWSVLLGRRGFDNSRYCEVLGLEHLRAALEHGKGVILLTAHFGYAKWIPRIMRANGFKVRRVVVSDPRGEKQDHINQWLAARGRLSRFLYHRTPVYSESREESDIIASLDVRPIIRALSGNQILVIAGDGVRATSFVHLPLLGQLYPFPTGFMKIAAINGSIVLPTFAFPANRNMSIRTEIRGPLAIGPDKSIEENVQTYAQTLSDQLTLTPHLWEQWSRAEWFENARRWASEEHEDPFTCTPPWSTGSTRYIIGPS